MKNYGFFLYHSTSRQRKHKTFRVTENTKKNPILTRKIKEDKKKVKTGENLGLGWKSVQKEKKTKKKQGGSLFRIRANY